MESVGSFLKRRREELGLTLEEIAQNTKINKKYLEAIEQDRFDLLPANVYGKVFVQSYAHRLGVSQEELEHGLEVIEETAVWNLDRIPRKRHSKYLDFIFVGAGLILGLVVLLVLLLKPEEKKTSDFEEASLRAMQNLPLAPAPNSDTAFGNIFKDSLELRIEAKGNTSATIVSEADTLFTGELKKGQKLSWKGLGFTLQVERARTVRIFLNDRQIKESLTKNAIPLNLDINPQNYREFLETKDKS